MGHPEADEVPAPERRARLIRAMVVAVSRDSYSGVTIAELVREAGMSKTAFYDYFADKEECFLASVDEIMRVVVARTAGALVGAGGLAEGTAAAIGALAEAAIDQPEAARLLVVDSIELGSRSLDARRRNSVILEAMIEGAIGLDRSYSASRRLRVQVLVGGLRGVLYRRLAAGNAAGLRDHVGELAGWSLGLLDGSAAAPRFDAAALVESELATDARRRAGGPEEPPEWSESPRSRRARQALDGRRRMVRAAARVASRDGYGTLSIPTISAEAGTSNATFYEHFQSKRDALLAGFEALTEDALARSRIGEPGRDTWERRAAASILAMLETFAREPMLARLAFFELPAAGPRATDGASEALRPFSEFLRSEDLPEGARRPPEIVLTALTAGIWSIVERAVTEGRARSLPRLAPEILEIALAPLAARG